MIILVLACSPFSEVRNFTYVSLLLFGSKLKTGAEQFYLNKMREWCMIGRTKEGIYRMYRVRTSNHTLTSITNFILLRKLLYQSIVIFTKVSNHPWFSNVSFTPCTSQANFTGSLRYTRHVASSLSLNLSA